MTVDPFVYAEDVASVGVKHAHVAVVPAGLAGRDELFRCLNERLELPEHFGGNWDALDECLRDLSWIPVNRVVLFHEGLPRLDDDQLEIYLDVLGQAVLDWRRDPDDELVVGLPPCAKDLVSGLLQHEG